MVTRWPPSWLIRTLTLEEHVSFLSIFAHFQNCFNTIFVLFCYKLSCASEVGSPTNHLGLWADTGPWILWSVHRWTFKKETDHTFDLFLLRQVEPGTSKYILSRAREVESPREPAHLKPTSGTNEKLWGKGQITFGHCVTYFTLKH